MAQENLLNLKNGKKWGYALAVELARQTKKEQTEVMEIFVKDLVTKILSVTPPQAGGRLKGTAAKKRGEQTTENQIRRVFEGVNKTQAYDRNLTPDQSIAWMAATHKRARVKGRVNRGRVRVRSKVMKGKLNRYIRLRKSKVGVLAAGWGAAADKFGVRGRNYPMWMRRHKGTAKSSAQFTIKKDNIYVKFSNRVRFAGDVEIMRGRLNWAMGSQAEATFRKRMRKGLKAAVKHSRVVDWG